jgi:antitoxin component YwqK of YwqJK toxin-antitoxin module
MKLIFSHILIFISLFSFGQDTKGNFIKDKKCGCIVWFKNGFAEDSVSWTGDCKNGFANGQGTIIGYTKGKPTSKYIGDVTNGKPNGKGVFTFANNMLKLEGNFSNGEILNLREDCLQHLHKQIIYNTDSLNYYVGDNNERQLYYQAVIPAGKIKGAIVLLPGTWETTEHLISSNQKLCELAYDKNIAVIVGNPVQAQKQYIYYSCYSHSQTDGGNAKFLKDTPVRIYDDVDPNWWMTNRDVDMYDMNALDQSAMILFLNDAGNKNAEFINAYGKGYRIEGNRHPHSWSIVEPNDTINWITKYIN